MIETLSIPLRSCKVTLPYTIDHQNNFKSNLILTLNLLFLLNLTAVHSDKTNFKTDNTFHLIKDTHINIDNQIHGSKYV